MENKDVLAGNKFASDAIDTLREINVIGEQPLLFYTSMIGTHLGNIVAHIGQEATLAMLDCLREQIATLPFNKPSETTTDG